MVSSSDTIFALSSGRPRSAIAVVRISGPRAGQALEVLGAGRPMARYATRAALHGADGTPIDDALVLWFPAPASATGEDVAELHVHGSQAVIAALFAELQRIGGLRPAEAGEFTRRSFENGKLELTEIEGLADLIDAETEMQRRQALRQLKGFLGKRAEAWRAKIVEACALIEAGIDFSDEGDVPDELMQPALKVAQELRGEIVESLGKSSRSERLREGLVVAIAGPPNAGKSTLLNRLADRDAAIVSPHAGTTRDVIEVHLDLAGYPLVLIDTAGIRDSDDPVEQEGVRRARERAEEADLVLWLVDASERGEAPGEKFSADVWTVFNKVDLVPGRAFSPPFVPANVGQTRVWPDGTQSLQNNDAVPQPALDSRFRGNERGKGRAPKSFAVSAATGQGVEVLTRALAEFAANYFGSGESALVSRARHRALLQEAAAALGRATQSARLGEEIVAEELRAAAQALGRLTGRVDVEDILGKIFNDFCVGK
jgi:tRNA modification GTPase